MKFDEVIKEIEKKGIMPRKQSLSPLKIALKQLKISNNPKNVVLIAGTNGKGSVAKTLHTLLVSQKLKVGLYTSPHLICTCERIQINNKNISKQLFVSTFNKIKDYTSSLTHFEILTLIAAYIFFVNKKVDWAIFEVGLGGKFDATNAIKHQTSVITTLGIDHEHILGSKLPDIAKNKFGIIKKNNLVISAKLDRQLKKLKIDTEKRINCRWKFIDKFKYSTKLINNKLNTKLKMYNQKAKINLHSASGVTNTALALTVFKNLGFKPKHSMSSLKYVSWPGRMSELKIKSKAKIYLSGDHNVQGIESLIDTLKYFKYETLHIVVGLTKHKNQNQMLPILFNLKNSTIYITTPSFMGKVKKDYKLWLKKSEYFKNPVEALNSARTLATKKDLIVVTGSLYLIGDIVKKFKVRL